ncbi:hypothetical protein ARALYDRAFT_354973 [Arabidopsis lyrata subsp. lyrata]|uniref:Uncharacterized protein n=1 Tax=Arabidopsis lyrata subsp. lyrata TaxID=81972 RepID=D7MDE5_ARALL|nr:hypothetical protein ARALYDRAFT_354973 [Arabidopsis lyrata subsp. lyrata]
MSWPIWKQPGPAHLAPKIRFDWNSNLSPSSQSRCSFMKPSVRRLHLDNKLPLLLVWLKIFLDNLLLELSRTLAFEASNLNELGIMIQSIRNCGYRCVFMLPSSTRLIHEPVKLPLINLLKFPLKNLKTSGIMIPIQCSGGYHNIFKSFSPEPKTATNPITIFRQSILNPVQTLGKALLRVDILIPVRFPALAFSTLLSLRSKTVAIFSSIEVFMEEASLFLDLTGKFNDNSVTAT